MPSWSYVLKLSDVFHDEDMPFLDKRDEIVKRIRAAKFFSDRDLDLVEIVEALAATSDVPSFDYEWSGFYDWADHNRVWVETM